MKKHLLTFLMVLSLLTGHRLQAQSNVCSFTTCVPAYNFNQTDNMQIYAAILASRLGTAVISSGSVVVTNTVNVTGRVGGYSTKKQYTLPTSTVAYSAGDCVGGDISIENLRRSSGLPFVVYEVAFFDSSGHTPDLNVTFLTYPYSTNVDNSPTQFTADQLKYLGDVSISSSDWVVTGTTSRVVFRYVGIVCEDIELTAVVTTNTAMTLPSRTCFVMKLSALQD